MILALDAGNTTVRCGCLEDGEVRLTFGLEMREKRTEYEYAVLLGQILALRGIAQKDFEGAVISSVVPRTTQTLVSAVRLVTGKRALVVGAGVRTGLNIGIDDPSQLGANLVAGAVAALSGREPPVIIVDMSTATTLMVIDRNSRVRGGAILPGADVSLTALCESASLLPSVPLEAPKRCICSNTIDCMRSGAVIGAAAAVDGMILRMERELGESARIVATGENAGLIIPCCDRQMELDENLTLRGLGMIWERNRRR